MVVMATYITHYTIQTKIMAKQTEGIKMVSNNISRPGIHSKSKSSKLKTSKNYVKKNVGQGK